MAASEKYLGDIHQALAEMMLARIRSGEEVTASFLKECREFLKDNKVACDVNSHETLGLLQEEMPEFDELPFSQ